MLRRDVPDATRIARSRPADPSDRRIRQTWYLFAATFSALGVVMLLRLGAGRDRPLDWGVIGLLVVLGFAAIRNRLAVQALETGRRLEAEGFARILSGLSRSVSAEAIVDAIVEELAAVTRADHVVVVRRRPGAHVLEATLVSARPGVPSSTTLLPLSDLADRTSDRVGADAERVPVAIPIRPDPQTAPLPATAMLGHGGGSTRPGAPVMAATAAVAEVVEAAWAPATAPPTDWPADTVPDVLGGRASGGVEPGRDDERAGRVAARIADRVRSVYGLKHSLAATLVVDGEPIGAIVLSRRVANTWPASTEALLDAAASEASAALSRAYSHRQAETLASTDALTGLPNRRYFDEFCGLLARRRRAQDGVGVLMIDIDRFKALNDRFGHSVGDEVLRSVAGAIATAVREADVPARYGGEEFAVLLRNPGPSIAVEVGERVRTAVHSLDLRGLGVPGVSVSVGVALATDPDQPIAAVVELADRALYSAKRSGRDRVIAA